MTGIIQTARKVLLAAIGWLKQNPAAVLTFTTSIFYWFHASHMPWFYRLGLILPVCLFNYGAAYGSIRLLRKRLSVEKTILWPELTFAFVLSAALYIVEFRGNITLFIIIIMYMAWIFSQFFLKNSGTFYTGVVGLFIFSTVLVSFQLMNMEADLVIASRNYFIHRQAAQKAALEIKWERAAGENRYILMINAKKILELSLAEELFFHGPEAAPPGNPGGGRPLGFISSSRNDASMPPAVAIFEIESEQGASPEDFRQEMEMLLGQLQNSSEISDLTFLNLSELKSPESHINLQGIFWKYRDAASSREMKSGVYLTEFKNGRQIALILRDPVVPGFRHHPDILFILQNLKF